MNTTYSKNQLANATVSLAHDLLSMSETDKNVVFSPTSIISVLWPLALGADGDTRDEIMKIVGADIKDDNQLLSYLQSLIEQTNPSKANVSVLKSGNFMLLNNQLQNLNQKYLSDLSGLVRIGQANFANPAIVVDSINKQVATFTQQMIKEILNKNMIDHNTAMLIVNAIFFKGKWKLQFDPMQTKPEKFWINSKNFVTVPFMKKQGEYAFYSNLDYKQISLPYSDGEHKMVVVIPNSTYGIEQLMSNYSLAQLFNTRYAEMHDVWLTMPKFNVESDLALKEMLISLGMRTAFGRQADFRKIVLDNSIFLKTILHKAAIKVEEEGTTAAASTVALLGVKGGSFAMPIQMELNRPFVYGIVNSHGNLLFVGKMCNPALAV